MRMCKSLENFAASKAQSKVELLLKYAKTYDGIFDAFELHQTTAIYLALQALMPESTRV